MSPVIQTYIKGSPALDPVFVTLRQENFDSAKSWVQVSNAIFGKTTRKVGPFRIHALTPALGWEIRPWTTAPQLDDRTLEALLGSLNSRSDWDMCQINCLSEDEVRSFGKSLARSRNRMSALPFPVRVLPGAMSYQNYLTGRGASANRTQRRYLRSAEKAGFVFREGIVWADIERVLDVRAAGFTNGSDYTQCPRFRKFFKAFIEELRAANRLLAVGMYQGATLVGYTLGFWNDGVLHCYQTAYDPSFAGHRPGSLTIEKTIERALDAGVQVIDFMGDHSYLAFYSKDVLPLQRIVFFANTLKGRFLATTFHLRNSSLNS